MPTNFELKRLKPKLDIIKNPENGMHRLTDYNETRPLPTYATPTTDHRQPMLALLTAVGNLVNGNPYLKPFIS